VTLVLARSGPFRPTRRRVLRLSGGALAAAGTLAVPALSRAQDRPAIAPGVQSGDVGRDSAMLWGRADREARLQVEVATTESFKDIIDAVWMDVLPESDFTGKLRVDGLPAGQDVFYRVRPQNLFEPAIFGEPVIGRFRTAPNAKRDVSFCFSGDTAGQGWGIDEARGGMKIYEVMRRTRPDFFIHSGDNIYADNPILPEQKMPDGGVWKNVVTEEKSRVAETLADFRGNYKYNWLDRNFRAFHGEVPVFAQWDDHEVTNNWWPQEPLTRAEHQRKHYAEKNAFILQARAARAFREYLPCAFEPREPGRVYRKLGYGPLVDVFMLDMRSYRGPNGENTQTEYGPDAYFLGPAQVAWLKRKLKASKATWKVIANDMPLSLIVVYDFDRKWGSEAIAQGDGPPLGRELEIADILSFIKRERIVNTVWVTADVHYAAAHYYDPGKAVFQDFDPFWEFVGGPLHAGMFGPNTLDNTFGPQLKFIKAPPAGQANLPPIDGTQFFGHAAIDGKTEAMTVSLRDNTGATLYSVTLEAKRA
jgi:alkaline phosphatase D